MEADLEVEMAAVAKTRSKVRRGLRKRELPVGLVLAGAVARGAYEAGALRRLLPALERREGHTPLDQRPRVIVGTSAGAINAAFLASRADRPAQEAADELDELWKQIEDHRVFKVTRTSLANVRHRLGGGIVDTTPLRETLEEHMGDGWARIRENIANGRLDALGIVATSWCTGRTTVFVADAHRPGDGDGNPFIRDDDKGVDYVRPGHGIGIDHVMASAAVPAVFPPVLIEENHCTDWYVDGGLRLNTPIKPALELGAGSLAIIAADPARPPLALPQRDPGPLPDLDDTVLAFLQAALASPLVEDVYRLGRVNELIESGGRMKGKAAVPYMIVAPEDRGDLGRAAGNVRPRSTLTRVLRWLAGRQNTQGRELLSYALFEREFFETASELGCGDAATELERMELLPKGWRLKSLRRSG
jgi:NTE family protein